MGMEIEKEMVLLSWIEEIDGDGGVKECVRDTAIPISVSPFGFHKFTGRRRTL